MISDSVTVYSFIECWREVLQIYDKADSNRQSVIFRGHSKDTYEPLASVFRKDKDGNCPNEKELYHEALVNDSEEFKKNEHLSNLVKMQHYGSQTRLLDFSFNPLISLYCASEQYPDTDGQVLAVRIKKSEILPHTSDKVLMLACLPLFDKQEQDEIKRFCSAHTGVIRDRDIPPNSAMHRFLHEIRSEFPAFETEIVGEHLLHGYFVRAHKDNDRMKAQDGLFYIGGLGDMRREVDKHICKRITIAASAKKQILRELRYMNISDDTMYPGFERRLVKQRNKRIEYTDVD